MNKFRWYFGKNPIPRLQFISNFAIADAILVVAVIVVGPSSDIHKTNDEIYFACLYLP